ncbi:Metalloenzyme, LuxS/M16 peptidase-like protein [Mycena alexandri]|uniref:Metalloenzyme, LuxS/M16 peptidase-like protein n=1 Tax=Mycena alexandri TaxID=1745969 RepID=A0AAD6X7A3_9AGAR|nr:Metalloenzyme, LuxS/M16 peptidase-like protein [Mycena alexandri]
MLRFLTRSSHRYTLPLQRTHPLTPTLSTRKMASLATEKFGNFDLVKRFKLGFTDVTGMSFARNLRGFLTFFLSFQVAKQTPIVNGYFTVATEIFDDSGCPHTLEHLVFMGSEKYPYKGIIDHLANRGFSNGTNAWTDNDHTAYTDFLQLLPIYVDHILYPTMTKAGSVHHIDPKGQDSGVVYSEMQGRENTSGDLMGLRLQRLLDPPGNAYRSETGGLMDALRVLMVEQIRQYHGTYYVPHNLSLIVTGKLSSGTSTLLSVVQEQVEPTLIAHGQNLGPRPPGWKRPFVETPSALRPPIEVTIKDTCVGELIISSLGPAPNQFLERKALDLLGTYLTSSCQYIEVDTPMCTYIYFAEETRATALYLPIYIGSIPTEHIDEFDTKLKASLRRIVSEGIDMERMAMVINRDERQLRSKLESAKGDTFSGTVITDFLYGAEDGSELEASMDEINQYAAVREWTSKQWTDVLQKYYIDSHSVVLRGKPSASLAAKLDSDEKARVAAQVARLGPDGLKKAEKELDEAKAEHDKPIPTQILLDFAVPSVKSIAFIPVQSLQEQGTGRAAPMKVAKSEALTEHVQSDGSALPFFVQYDHVESDFVSVQAFFSLTKLPHRLRPLISTYLQSGERLTHEDVVNKLDNETVSYEVGLGLSNSFAETFRISIKVEIAQYETAIAWLKDLMYGAEFDKERLQVTIAKIQQSLPEMKRDGNTVLGSLWADLLYNEASTSRAGGILPADRFHAQACEAAPGHPGAGHSMICQEIRRCGASQILFYFSLQRIRPGVRFSVTGNVLKLTNPRSTWGKYFEQRHSRPCLCPSETLSKLGEELVKKAIVMSLPTIESSYVTHSAKAIKGFNHPEYPAFRVALESYLWRYIRGSGLAYGAYSGLLSFSLYRSSNSMDAYKEASKVLAGLVDETSTVVYGVAKNVSTAGRAAIMSFSNQALRGVSQTHQVELLEKYQVVTKEDYFLPLFDASKSVAIVVTAPSKVDAISDGLTEVGFEVEKRTLEIDPSELAALHDHDHDCDSCDSGSESGERFGQ